MCFYSFEVHLSPCANSTNVSVTAYSTNILGNSSLSRPFFVTLGMLAIHDIPMVNTHCIFLDDSRCLKSEDFGQILILAPCSASVLVLIVSCSIFITVTTILVRNKAKIQTELQQARETIRRMTSVNYEEIPLDRNMRHSNVLTQENVAYGHVSNL